MMAFVRSMTFALFSSSLAFSLSCSRTANK